MRKRQKIRRQGARLVPSPDHRSAGEAGQGLDWRFNGLAGQTDGTFLSLTSSPCRKCLRYLRGYANAAIFRSTLGVPAAGHRCDLPIYPDDLDVVDRPDKQSIPGAVGQLATLEASPAGPCYRGSDFRRIQSRRGALGGGDKGL